MGCVTPKRPWLHAFQARRQRTDPAISEGTGRLRLARLSDPGKNQVYERSDLTHGWCTRQQAFKEIKVYQA